LYRFYLINVSSSIPIISLSHRKSIESNTIVPPFKIFIGCTTLLAVSGIQAGRRGKRARDAARGRQPARLLQYRRLPSTSPQPPPPAHAAGFDAARAGSARAGSGPAGSTHHRHRSWPTVRPGSLPPASGRHIGYGAGGQLLPPRSGVGQCPLAIGHRLSAGLPVGVPDRRG
jgi:hypothetical protein